LGAVPRKGWNRVFSLLVRYGVTADIQALILGC
jgi:hypothetical protein